MSYDCCKNTTLVKKSVMFISLMLEILCLVCYEFSMLIFKYK
jgi:hypothetical protein